MTKNKHDSEHSGGEHYEGQIHDAAHTDGKGREHTHEYDHDATKGIHSNTSGAHEHEGAMHSGTEDAAVTHPHESDGHLSEHNAGGHHLA